MQHFDALIIGGGQAGPPLAVRLAGAGKKVAVIERARLGGTCVNTGCIPTKAMVASAYAAQLARRGAEYGVMAGDIKVDLRRVKARKDEISGASRQSVENWLAGTANLTVIRGHARFVEPHVLQVGDERYSAPWIFLNVGTRPYVPEWPGLRGTPYLTNESLLDLEELPEHLVVVGGSYIGLEFGQMFRRFGSRVTIIEKSPRLIAHEDEDVSLAVQEILEGEGIEVRTGADCIDVRKGGAGVAVRSQCEGGEHWAEGTHLLVAVGRSPNTDDLGLDRAGVEVDRRGYIRIDDQLRTSVEGIWALGDCNGRGAFTHTSYNDYEIAAANLLDNEPRRVSDRITTYALFIDPPLGRVGMTLAEARAAGRDVLLGTRPMSRVGRAVERGESKGFMKVIVDTQSKRILGAAILGASGDEAIHSLLDAMYADAPVHDGDTCGTHSSDGGGADPDGSGRSEARLGALELGWGLGAGGRGSEASVFPLSCAGLQPPASSQKLREARWELIDRRILPCKTSRPAESGLDSLPPFAPSWADCAGRARPARLT